MKAPHLRVGQHARQELVRHVARQQPVAVFAEARLVPGHIIDAESDKPAEQEVEFQPLHELPFRAKTVKGLQEQCRISRSGGIDGRPAPAAYSESNSALRLSSAELDDRPIGRSGWSALTRASRSTYENNDPDR